MIGADEEPDLGRIVARRLAELRAQRQLSLEGLAKLSGVSRAMLWQIEQGRSAPTVKVLGRVAAAMSVPVIALLQGGARGGVEVLRQADGKRLRSADGLFESRALFPFSGVHTVEFYEMRLEPSASEAAQPHPAGTTENLVVHSGHALIEVDGRGYELAAGDALYFHADVAHGYRNPGTTPALLYLVMHYPATLNYG